MTLLASALPSKDMHPSCAVPLSAVMNKRIAKAEGGLFAMHIWLDVSHTLLLVPQTFNYIPITPVPLHNLFLVYNPPCLYSNAGH
jgi:hypothetical protein